MSKGLGKGLGALISMFDEDMEELTTEKTTAKSSKSISPAYVEKVLETAVTQNKEKTASSKGPEEIDITLIDNNINQPRKSFDPEAMHELEQSIIANGILQPILVNRVGTRYMIVAGERRWRASKNVGLKTIPALVREYTQKQIAEIALVENLMRSDLNEIEVSIGIKKLMDTHHMTQDQVSKVLGKSRSAVANSLRILNLPKEVQDLLEQKRISVGHAKCLVAVSDKNMCITLATKCANGEMTVRDLENTISGKPNSMSFNEKTSTKKQSLELKQFQLSLVHNLMTKVNIVGDDNHGKIVIEYSSRKDLERIMDKIK